MKNALKFALGATLFAPVLLLEDGLRKAGMDVPEKGLLHNHEGKGIMEIWNEAGAKVKLESVAKMSTDNLIARLKSSAVKDVTRHDSEMLATLKAMGINLV